MKNAALAALFAVALFNTACSSAPQAAAPAAAAPAAAAAPKDAALAANVKAALDADSELAPFNLQVTGKDADVTINGNVDTGLQMAKAGMVAEKVKGVRYVANNIMPKQ
ncbi:BON domain-containing protein [Amantichitinum ursilacus]|uniref:Periplasmic protein n=1 Tax=Amantichitinum ursilacus TaxID=857265 RepID=A0A0N1JSF8_9NEIS|nr:BON domain-containing protein [Amantichitinum ursilacus]KPC52085.1 periplasmic protein [Amantichitinum ursilacus]